MNKNKKYKREKVPLAELKSYLESKKIGKFIFSNTYQRNCMNSYTFRMNMTFENMEILFNPNKIFLYGRKRDSNDKKSYIIIERIKYTKVEELDSGIIIEFVCGDLNSETDNYTYSLYAEKNI